MHGSDLEAQVRAELEQIMPLVSALTGLPTHWSGVVEPACALAHFDP